MKPAQLIPGSLTLALFAAAAPAWGQAPDAEPAAVAPAPPPAPAPPAPVAAQPPPAELPPPPPPKSAPPPPPEGKMVVSAPPVPPARARAGYHVHDGFYLRLGAGLGGGSASISTNRESAPNFEIGGAGLAGNLWLGGTPWRGIAIGGLISLQGINESETVVEGDETDLGMNGGMLMLAPFIDAFPDPQRGLHFGGALGLAFMSAKAKGKELETRLLVKDYDGGGLGLSGWVGYMGWVGQEWSLGGMLQLTGFITTKEEDGLKRQASGGTLSVSFSALFH